MTFIQKKLLESVQGESNPIYLCPHKFVIPSVGHQKSCFFTSISLIPIFFNYISKNVTKKFIKMKAGLQNRQFSYQFLRFGEMLKFGQNIHTKENELFIFLQTKCTTLKKTIINCPNLVSLLFVGGYLAEPSKIDPRNSLT